MKKDGDNDGVHCDLGRDPHRYVEEEGQTQASGGPREGEEVLLDSDDDPDAEVNEEDLNFLLECGVPAPRAVEALRATRGEDRSAALNWVSDNPEKPSEPAPAGSFEPSKPKLSAEEAKQKALELQARLRKKRLEREEAEKRESERNRIASTKAMAEAKRQFEEAEAKRYADQMMREREEAKQAERRQKELLAQEYKERFGKEMKIEDTEEEKLAKMNSRERVLYYVGKLKALVTKSSEEKAQVMAAIKLVRVYCNQAKLNPTEKKYQRLKKSNKIFAERVLPYDDAVKLLNAVGFAQQEDGDTLMIETVVPDGFLLGECIKFLDFIISKE